MAIGRWEIKQKMPFGSLSRIARQLEKSPSHVSHVVSGQRRDADVEKAIARKLRMKRFEVFPPLEGAA